VFANFERDRGKNADMTPHQKLNECETRTLLIPDSLTLVNAAGFLGLSIE
jgi:hypothetical protein